MSSFPFDGLSFRWAQNDKRAEARAAELINIMWPGPGRSFALMVAASTMAGSFWPHAGFVAMMAGAIMDRKVHFLECCPSKTKGVVVVHTLWWWQVDLHRLLTGSCDSIVMQFRALIGIHSFSHHKDLHLGLHSPSTPSTMRCLPHSSFATTRRRLALETQDWCRRTWSLLLLTRDYLFVHWGKNAYIRTTWKIENFL